MASAPVLDFEALVQPVPGDHPAGSSMPLTIRQELETLRKEFEPNPDNPSLPPVPKKPDWPKIQRMTEDVLTNTSKDLETTFRLTEALIKLHGFAGLRDGFHLLHELINQCWDRLHPTPEEGEGMEVRTERFYWILEPDKGARFPQSVRAIPVVRSGENELSYRDLLDAMQGQGPVPATAFDSGEPISADVAEDIAAALTNLTQLERSLTEKCPQDAPSFAGLRQAMEECQGLVKKVTRGVAADESSHESNGAVSGDGAGGVGFDSGRAVASREEAYRQLGQIANVLERLEPHSPIPYLLRRAIELGRMPFPQLIHELVRNPDLLMEVRREFGIKEGQPQE